MGDTNFVLTLKPGDNVIIVTETGQRVTARVFSASPDNLQIKAAYIDPKGDAHNDLILFDKRGMKFWNAAAWQGWQLLPYEKEWRFTESQLRELLYGQIDMYEEYIGYETEKGRPDPKETARFLAVGEILEGLHADEWLNKEEGEKRILSQGHE